MHILLQCEKGNSRNDFLGGRCLFLNDLLVHLEFWSFGVFAQACLLLETDAQVRDVAHGLLVLRLG